jgi:hypothetical protein
MKSSCQSLSSGKHSLIYILSVSARYDELMVDYCTWGCYEFYNLSKWCHPIIKVILLVSGKPNIAAAAGIFMADTPLTLKEAPVIYIHKGYIDSTAIYICTTWEKLISQKLVACAVWNLWDTTCIERKYIDGPNGPGANRSTNIIIIIYMYSDPCTLLRQAHRDTTVVYLPFEAIKSRWRYFISETHDYLHRDANLIRIASVVLFS